MPRDTRLDLTTPEARGAGRAFLEAVAAEVAGQLAADTVGIAVLDSPEGERVRCLALYRDGRVGEGPAYALAGTPCADIVGQRACIHPRGVVERFPEDALLRELGAEAYAGTPLWSADGAALGLLFALFRRPLATEEAEGARRLLALTATGVAAELERGTAVAALRGTERRLEALFEQGTVGVAEVDPAASRFLRANRAFCRMLGRTPDELRACGVEEVTHPDDRERTRGNIQRLAAGEAADFSMEKAYLRKDGSTVWGRATVLPLEAADGGPRTWLVLVEDIHERKQAEAALRRAQKMEAVGRLAGGIAHDFNNLLTAIRGYAELLLADAPREHPVREHLAEIARAGDRAAHLTGQLLAFSRRLEHEPRPADPGAVLREAEGMLRHVLGERVRLEVGTEPGGPLLRIDHSQLEQIVMNLAINARDAMPEGGELRVATRPATREEAALVCREGAPPPRGFGVVEVRDTGVGMDDATLEHVFEPFFTTKDPETGTGLGLSTVYGIARQCGGEVLVESRPAAGTRFRVLLPVAGEAAPAEAGTAPAEADEPGPELRPAGAGTVLWVEDEPGVRRWLGTLLRRRGYRVLEAEGPERALAIAREEQGPIDALVSDVVMPQMSGPELAERLAGLRPELAERVLFVSGYSAAEPGRSSLPANAAFLQKPFHGRELLDRLRALLAERPQEEEKEPPPAPADA